MTEINPDDLFLVPELDDDGDGEHDHAEGPPMVLPDDAEERGE